MPDHDFEKTVKDRMEELRIPPSAPVWERLDTQLARKEKRRRGIFWIPLSLAAACLLIYFVPNLNPFANNTTGKNKVAVHEAEKDKRRPENMQQQKAEFNVVTDRTKPRPEQIEERIRKADQELHIDEAATASIPSRPVTPSDALKNKTRKITSASPSLPAESTINMADPPVNQALEKTGKNDLDILLPGDQAAGTYEAENAPEPAVVSAGVADLSVISTFRTLDDETPSLTLIPPATPRRWQIGFNASVGRVNLTDGKFNGLLNGLFASDMVPESLGNAAGQPNAPTAPIYVPPSRTRAGLAFEVGAFAKSSIARKSSVIAGLQYNYYSVSHQTGYKKDTTLLLSSFSSRSMLVSDVYAHGSRKNYVNRFHFIQLPVTFETRVVSGKIPVYWNAGVSVSRLFATNALYYDNGYRLYYQDKSQFRKYTWSVHTGLSTTIFNKSGNMWTVGPEASYMASNLMADKTSEPKHFFYIGLKSSVMIKNRR